ncbi:MAG TPA: HAMP domain-containing sensor histidine kinase [Anaerolineales bacterium]|nr:HAMP domain-containing sensor histidine kinase [Anaerolineales bacterium]
MTDYFRRHLGAKLFLSYLAVIVIGMVILVVASQFILPTAFNRHMAGMGLGNGNIMGMGNGQGRGNPMSQLYVDFRASFNDALTYAALAAILVAFVISLFFSRSVIAPLRVMSLATQHIADGHYEERVQVNGADELAQLAARFNQMAEKLDQVESMRRRLIGDVSHELRTPLTAIKGSMEGLMDGVLPATSETYQQIHAEADRLNRLVDDLQELSRVEARAYELNLRSLDVSSLVKIATKRLAPQAESKRITLDFELAPDLPRVLADEDRAVQILINLIGNALQYTPEKGKVLLSAKRMNNEVQISIRDTGIGIPSEHLPHIFDRFYRVDKSRSRRAGGGSGIGLTIARALVEAHGGRIWAESAGEGQGSTFTFTLPIANTQE